MFGKLQGRRYRERCFQLTIDRAFEIVIVYDDAPTQPSFERIASLFARVLGRMLQLEQLSVHLHKHHATVFAREFAKAKIVLPCVRKLDIEGNCGFAVKACPNVREIRSVAPYVEGSTLDFLKAIRNAPKLEIFIRTDFWTTSFLEGRSSQRIRRA